MERQVIEQLEFIGLSQLERALAFYEGSPDGQYDLEVVVPVLKTEIDRKRRKQMETYSPGAIYWLRREGPRPTLTIEHVSGKNLGPCWNVDYYRVTSLGKLDLEKLEGLFRLGFLGIGQSFRLVSTEEKKDIVDPVEIGPDGKPDWNKVPINKWSKEPVTEKSYQLVYIYNVATECDSSD